MIFSLTEKTKTVVVIELQDLSIFNRKNELVYQSALARRFERKYRSWGGGRAVYRSVNYVLQDYNNELIPMIENEIRYLEDK